MLSRFALPFFLVAAIEGRREDVLTFRRLGSAPGTVDVHPHTFHNLLENVPAASWQVSQLDDGLRIAFVGLPDSYATSELAASVRAHLAALGADTGAVGIERVTELVRGQTGKAALVRRAATRETAGAR